MSYLQVTGIQEVSSMVRKPKTDPVACYGDIMAMQDALDILGGKWKLLILHYLMIREEEKNTFKKMEKDIGGISAKVLSKELKMLEANKLISRAVMNTSPVTVAYSITEYGKQARAVMSALVDWGMQHRVMMFSATV